MPNDYTTLKALAEAAKGWKINHVRDMTDEELCEVGHRDEDGVFYPFLTLDCENYYQPSGPLAHYLAAASPDVVLALIARVAEVEKDAARYRQIKKTTKGEFDKMVRLAGMYGQPSLDELLDAAMGAQA